MVSLLPWLSATLISLLLMTHVFTLKDNSQSLITSTNLNDGGWIVHRGHKQTKWISWLPNSYTSTSSSDLYLFEGKDICRCARQSSNGLDIIFLGGDSTRALHLTTKQIFSAEPFEPRKTSVGCDIMYSNPNTPCGHMVANPLESNLCHDNNNISALHIWSMNFDKYAKPFSTKEIIATKALEACKHEHHAVFIIDLRSSSVHSFKEYLEATFNTSDPTLKGCKYLTLLHSPYDTTDVNDITPEQMNKFYSNKIPFLDFNGIYKNFSSQYTNKQIFDFNPFKHLEVQLVLNSICNVSPDQAILFGSRIGSFQLREIKHFEEGTLLRSGLSKAISVYLNGSLHEVPNWDTFLSHGFDANKIHPVDPEIWDYLDVGEPLPPCTGC